VLRQTTKSIFDFIDQYIVREGFSPTQREIADACHLTPQAVIRHLDFLEARGWIIREPGRVRSIRIPRATEV
jgi:SOS-response transcriptional repressor LexA